MIDLSGIMTAIVTPLNPDRTVNEEQLEKLIEFQLANKVHSILALGGTRVYRTDRCRTPASGGSDGKMCEQAGSRGHRQSGDRYW